MDNIQATTKPTDTAPRPAGSGPAAEPPAPDEAPKLPADQQETDPPKKGRVPARGISLMTGLGGVNGTLADPMADSQMNTSAVLAIGDVVGTSMEMLAKKFPELDKQVLYRIAESGVYATLSWCLMVWSHEGGHYQLAKKEGLDPSIHLNLPMGGETRYWLRGELTDPENPRRQELDATLSVGGMNQTELNAQVIAERIHVGDPRYHDAINYLVHQLDASRYIATSMIRERRGTVPGGDDNVSYAEAQAARGRPISTGEMMLPSLLADLFSGTTWSSLYGAVRYLSSGNRDFKPFTLQLGSVELTPPDFSYFRTAGGEAVEGSLFVNPRGNVPLRFSFASDLDMRGNGNDLDTLRFGVKAYGLAPPLTVLQRLSFNPYLYVNTDHGLKPTGYLGGSEVEVRLPAGFSLIGDVGYAHRDLINSRIRNANGLSAYAGFKVSF